MGFVVGAVVAFAVALLWARQKLKQAEAHLARVEQARQLAAQQITQARKQIEHLQKECQDLRMAAARPVHRQHAEPEPEPAVDPAEAARRYVEAKLAAQAAPRDEPEVFPETVILRRGGA
jgi:chromosome segregation ATPase